MDIIITHETVMKRGRNVPVKIQVTVSPTEGIMDVECGSGAFITVLVAFDSKFQKCLWHPTMPDKIQI